ncbi:MAG TPA: HAD family phosphatase, partial [Petrimonas sp.]|nr:HAD family phosphatase [Petrimonas sp.]
VWKTNNGVMSICALFDMDGVLIDTEPQYGLFWNEIANEYSLGIEDFENKVKGMTIPHIISSYFCKLSNLQIENIFTKFEEFEERVLFPDINGAIEFVRNLKLHDIRTALVTSSSELKLNRVLQQKHFDTIFDIIVSAKDIKNGKPAPDCFLLAAERLNFPPKSCVVFEDSLAGITAGNAAGMTVVGLSTTYPESELMDKCAKVIPDFENFTLNALMTIISNL